MKKKHIFNIFVFCLFLFATDLYAQISKSNVKITSLEETANGFFQCKLEFTVKDIYLSNISREQIVKFIVDSTDLVNSSVKITKFNNEEWDDKNRLFLYQEKIGKGKKKTSKFLVVFNVLPPFLYDFSESSTSNVIKLNNGLNMLYLGPFQNKEFYNPNGTMKCNNCEPSDSMRLMFGKLRYSDYDSKVLSGKAKELELLSYEKAEYKQFIDSLGVLSIINEGIQNGDLNDQNAKVGAVLIRFNEKLTSKFKRRSYYFNVEELEDMELKYIGTLSPITGILQCRRQGVLMTEYKVVDSVVSALRIYERPYNKPTGELTIDFIDNKYKAMYYVDYLNWWTYREGSVPISSVLLGLQNIKKITELLYVYGGSNNSVKNLIEKGISTWYDSGVNETYQGVWLSSVTHTELTDELSNSDLLLSKISSIKYKNKSNAEYDYFHLDFHTTDSVSSVTRIGELNGGKKYLQTYTFTKGSLLKKFYHNLRVDSTYSEHEIAGNKWKSQTPSAHIPMVVSTKRLSDSIYHVQYLYNKKLLFDAVLNSRSEIVGEAKIYSISSPLLKQYRTSKLNAEDKLNSIFKISLSFTPTKNEYTSSLSSLVNLADFSPNENKTIGLQYLYTNLMPLATSPLGTEITIKGSPAFVDRTGDYLAQKALFKNGKLMALYIFLPDGVCFDSLNLSLNEYGEQIGKSSVNEFPLSERYMALYNKSQKELEDRQTQAMIELLEALKKNDNTCDHCKNSLMGERIDIYDIDCPNGKSYMLNSKRRFCSLKCHSDYKKYWCDLQDN
jgi:hypothetical protein